MSKKVKTNRFAVALSEKGAGEEIVNAGKEIEETKSEDGENVKKESPVENINTASVDVDNLNEKEVATKVNIDDMVHNEANKIYSLDNIKELADNILENGLIHKILLRPVGDGKYRIISGHRRREALKLLSGNGYDEFKNPLSIIRNDITDDLDEELALHRASDDDRILNDVEKAAKVKRLHELYEIKRKRQRANGLEKGEEKITGKTRDLVGEDMNLSGIQVHRYIEINDKLIPEMKALIEEEILSSSAALEFKARSEEEQKIFAESIRNAYSQGKEFSREEAKKLNEQVVGDLKNIEENFLLMQEQLQNITQKNEKEKKELEDKYKKELKNKEGELENKYKKELKDKEDEAEKLKKEKDEITKTLDELKNKSQDEEKNEADNEELKKAQEKEKELQSKIDVAELDKQNYLRKIKELEQDKINLQESKKEEINDYNITGNIEVNLILTHAKTLLTSADSKLKEYFDKDFKLSDTNSKLLDEINTLIKNLG